MEEVYGLSIEICGPFMPCKLMPYLFAMQANYHSVRGNRETYLLVNYYELTVIKLYQAIATWHGLKELSLYGMIIVVTEEFHYN